MANTVSMSQSIAGRYAQAVFDIVKEEGGLDALAQQVQDLDAALADSSDLRDLINSPIYTREQQTSAIAALASKMGLSATLANTLQLMGKNRRLFVLPQLVTRLGDLIAQERGEVTADVISAVALSDEQQKRLADTLSEKSGKKVKLKTSVDETLIGGMIVKMGSQMIDSSVRSKLASLQNAMKEVG
ncbi:F0F1 ATP synthase subunit delta [Paracoccus fistulariae]|uniref:ATP synthase subunit delta n=1 Tax=Paracoccus fistulariae TaxID=658446 RepID=A0ABY7SMG6_9RHOB|nr:F0F1 ATP synthase subunit delta [Paracoccus fistulariae]MDB6180004.1 F0F1 ATP synthase subunit delta [Paracoccus fistulariae]WCR08095.1 F0F1 ATP synthase subunit delta [Paracoccus fistulariae]